MPAGKSFRFQQLTSLVVAVLLAGGVSPVAAQVIRGAVVDGSTQTPVPGAFVVLLDAGGTQRGGVLSGEGGSYILRAPAPGRYTLRAERIGYASALSDTLVVEAGRTLVYRFEINIQPVDLEGMKVTGRGRCRVSREMGAQTALVWDEVRKALSIAVWGDTERGVPFQTRLWSRSRDIVSLELISDTVHLSSGYGRTPFASESARSLGAKGYIRALPDGSYMFYGVDAQTILSDDFMSRHCFRVVQARRGQEGMVGLGFEPIHKTDRPDITGTLWLDRATSELRYLEFKYDRIPMAGNLPTGPFGGRVYFRRLDNGDWVVQRWWLRMPQSVSFVNPNADRRMNLGLHVTPDEMRAGAQRRGIRVHEQGGELRFIGAAGTGDVDGHATLNGTVFDSTRMVPLARANVFLTDANRATTTDFFGHFRLTGIPGGTHQVAFTHPYVDSLGLPVTPMTVTVSAHRYASVMLTVPKAAGCPTATSGIVGFVEDRRNGDPLPGVPVRAAWIIPGVDHPTPTRDRRVEVADTTDESGRYLFCDVPLEREVDVEPEGGGSVKIRLESRGIARLELLTHRPAG